MKVLFIGGTGIISSASSALALEQGLDLYLLTRGTSTRPIPNGAKILRGDIRDPESARRALDTHMFDVVVNWVAYTPDHIAADIARFQGRTGQYVFISSASAYHKPPISWPVTESTPLHNPYWQYSRDKIACEEALLKAYRDTGFPATLVRPSHTYDKTYIPLRGGYTVIDRMRKGQKVIIHGDGTSLWVMTHHRDFAQGFIGLLGNPQAIGEAYHITADEVLCWNQIYTLLAQAAGVQAPEFVHIPSAHIATYDQDWGDSLVGDKSHSMIFDNTKIKRAVPGFVAKIPFAQGAREIMAWHDAQPGRQVVDEAMNRLMDRIIAEYT
ncbi:MAG: NAD-dependent epimerase/dehydratase family protein [Anaerolineae bacterium]|nr:NAD-dependent epimerase/dehydratase family protein [Anaerolineae bacterium]